MMRDAPSESGLFANSLRTPPSNISAEQALLGAIMANAKCLHTVVEFLKPEHFAEPVNGRIYRQATKRILAGGVADPISLRQWFASDPEIEQLGVGYLSQLLTAMVGIINAREYGRAIYDCWQRRELIAHGEGLVNWAFGAEPTDTADTMISSMIDRLDAVVADSATERKALSMDQALDAAIAAAARAEKDDGPAGISTGMPSVDRRLGGLEAQTLTVLAGRPGMGKSALGWLWAVHAAREAKRCGLPGVFVVSLEMSAEQLGRRALSAVAQVPLAAMKQGRLSQADWDRIVLARRELDDLPLSIEDCSNLSIALIRLKARAARRRHGLGLIMVDHLHIVRPEEADVRNGATAAVGKVSNGMKQLAKEFDCPVLALAQLNRGVEGREDKRPTLADLQQSGQIEQDADAVAFVYRGDYYLPKGDLERRSGESQQKHDERVRRLNEDRQSIKGKAELVFAKVRDGSPGTVHLHFDGATTSFREAS